MLNIFLLFFRSTFFYLLYAHTHRLLLWNFIYFVVYCSFSSYRYKLAHISLHFTFHYRNNLKQIFAMKEKDTKNNSETPIVIKIEAPKEAMKKNSQNHEKKVEDDNLKPTSSKSKCCQFLPILLFLVTFAAVLTALIIYLDPSSKCYFKV